MLNHDTNGICAVLRESGHKNEAFILVALHINPVPRVHRLSQRFTNNVVVDELEDTTMKVPEINFYKHVYMEPICRSFLGSDIQKST